MISPSRWEEIFFCRKRKWKKNNLTATQNEWTSPHFCRCTQLWLQSFLQKVVVCICWWTIPQQAKCWIHFSSDSQALCWTWILGPARITPGGKGEEKDALPALWSVLGLVVGHQAQTTLGFTGWRKKTFKWPVLGGQNYFCWKLGS